eukprot:TRINITY_DN2044_c0_g1_i1.p1 TRINITY_DN2044_c0_g1~~TRINITY_DN2044_c0_g1_i1.p1  ORF type:complete len:491 (+),score=61.58 TRINITY_DN2044_c0_g1_i1:1758-3230(+)
MQADLPDLTESVACTSIQLRVAKGIIEKQWNAIQTERCRLAEEMEKFITEKEDFELARKTFEYERLWVMQNVVDEKVCLCVGGKYMATSKQTLTSGQGGMLGAMFSGRHKLALNRDGCIFLDRDPEAFRYVLDFLRTNKPHLPSPETQPELYAAVLDEFDYFCVSLPQTEPETLRSSFQWDKLTSDVLVKDSPCSTECIKVVGDILLCGRYDGYLEAWSLSSRTLLKRIKTEHETVVEVEALGNTVYTVGSGTPHIYVWDLNTLSVTNKLTGHLQDIRTIKLWNNILVSGSNDHTVKVWDISVGKCIATLEGHEGDVTAVDLDGELIVSGSEDCSVRVWNLATKACQGVFVEHADRITCVSLYRGKYVVSGSPDGMLKLWNVETGKCDRTFHIGFATCVWSLCISGSNIVCGCDENIKVWDLETGNPVSTLPGHQDHVWDVRVVDNILVSCSEDSTVRIWKQPEAHTPPNKKCKTNKPKQTFNQETLQPV